MNVKEYISSGIVESYVLGLVTETELQEFEAACAQYPEIAEAKQAFELSLESTLMQDAVPPPVHLKALIKESVFTGGPDNINSEETIEEDRKIIRLNTWKWLAAASFILLAGSLIWGISVNNKYNQVKGLAQQNTNLQEQLNQKDAQLAQIRSEAATLQNPDVKMASLKGTPVSPASFVTVYWDTTSKDVYLMVNNLPKPASDKQYQLWALFNGKPVDLGMLQMSEEKMIPMIKMKGVQHAQAFAITLEPKGGSQNPTMEQMYVVGKL